jgi:hypothetical protein
MVEVRTRVDLPPQVRRPYEVYVNGVAQTEGADFEVIGSSLFFNRTFVPERPMPMWRWLLLFLGVWTSHRYYAHDEIDVVHTLDGHRVVASLKLGSPIEAS